MANAPVDPTAQPQTNEGAETAQVPLCLWCGVNPQMPCDPAEAYIKEEGEGYRLEAPPSCGKYRHFCSGNCAKGESDDFNYTWMRVCGCCGVSQNEQGFEGAFDDCCSDEGHDY